MYVESLLETSESLRGGPLAKGHERMRGQHDAPQSKHHPIGFYPREGRYRVVLFIVL